jgi:hypothetical protein
MMCRTGEIAPKRSFARVGAAEVARFPPQRPRAVPRRQGIHGLDEGGRALKSRDGPLRCLNHLSAAERGMADEYPLNLTLYAITGRSPTAGRMDQIDRKRTTSMAQKSSRPRENSTCRSARRRGKPIFATFSTLLAHRPPNSGSASCAAEFSHSR